MIALRNSKYHNKITKSLECRRRTRKLIFINYINDDCIVENEKNMILLRLRLYTIQLCLVSYSPAAAAASPEWGLSDKNR